MTEDDKLIDEKFRSRDLALTVAIASLDKRLDGMNAFRESLSDQQTTFLTRIEYAARHDMLISDIKRLEFLTATLVSKPDFEKAESRIGHIETKLATWDGRLWALGTVFLLVNIFISWYLSGIGHAH